MKRHALKTAFPYTLPVLMGYLFLGIAFGVLLNSKGFNTAWAFVMSLLIYAGSMQFVAINLLVSPFQLAAAFFITLMVNARHLFYGLSMLDRFKASGRLKPYMMFSLTDETFSLLSSVKAPDNVNPKWFMFFIALLNQGYWIAGSLIGNIAGSLISFNSTGIDFAMTALFIVIFVEQWEQAKNHVPAILGIVITALCLILFGADRFILFAMAGILVSLSLLRGKLHVKESE
ncbi:branched-chain amino acid ABC transporter permease [Paenibacillus sp. HJL G12]|uniref:Branched-chain amino acid ABC transporter permease n=1 Tax=Paenibacillus dendrobii TaxID=2691084 RepID=A0A7X3IMT6_9BACL|nr:AzlC family ABC transporter permease [Paenibacillus dendrobii]MWV46438.1 branched-chain amino acid ABC transporter permease [Paenibacillus dendrobii]